MNVRTAINFNMSSVLKSKTPNLVTLLLLIALMVSLTKLVSLVIAPERETVISNIDTTVTVVQKKVADYGREIASQHIFGQVIIQPVTTETENTKTKEEDSKPVIKLNAKLHGIVAYRSQKGFALISHQNGPQKVYGENDTLQEGVTITKVLATKVLIDNNGVEQELLLPLKEEGEISKSSKQDVSHLPGKEKSSRSNKSNTNLVDLTQIKKDVLADPTKLTDIVRASPAIINGKFTGFRVRSGKNRKLFRQLNFRANDIITEVNGVVLDNQSKGLQVLAELENATDLSIKVKRGTQEIFIDHSF